MNKQFDTYYDGSGLQIYTCDNIFGGFQAIQQKLEKLSDDNHQYRLTMSLNFVRAYQLPMTIKVYDHDDPIIEYQTHPERLTPTKLDRWVTINRDAYPDWKDHIDKNLRDVLIKVPAILASAAALDVIMSVVGGAKEHLESHPDWDLALLPMVEYSPIDHPSDYVVHVLTAPLEYSTSDPDDVDQNQCYGEITLKRSIINQETDLGEADMNTIAEQASGINIRHDMMDKDPETVQHLLDVAGNLTNYLANIGVIDSVTEDDAKRNPNINESDHD